MWRLLILLIGFTPTLSFQCARCPPGYSTDRWGGGLNGYTGPEQGEVCAACSIGYYSLEGSSACTSCPPGTSTILISGGGYEEFSKATSVSQCVSYPSCPAGQAFLSGAPSARILTCQPCPPGRFRSAGTDPVYCSLCPSGTYTISSGTTDAKQCLSSPTPAPKTPTLAPTASMPSFAPGTKIQCPLGQQLRYVSDTATVCKPCPYGTYGAKDASGEETCNRCPSGTTTSIDGATSASQCDLNSCPPGQAYVRGSGTSSQSTSSSLSNGAVAGIVITVLFVVFGAAIVFHCYRQPEKAKGEMAFLRARLQAFEKFVHHKSGGTSPLAHQMASDSTARPEGISLEPSTRRSLNSDDQSLSGSVASKRLSGSNDPGLSRGMSVASPKNSPLANASSSVSSGRRSHSESERNSHSKSENKDFGTTKV